MGATFNRVKTWGAEILTFLSLNAEFDNILNNFDPDGMDDASANNAAMQANTDPYPGATESLPTDLRGELQRLRYLLKQQHVTSQWYVFPDLVSKTGAYTATMDDRVILCDATSGAFTVTLPTAVGATDKIFYIKKTDSSANAVTIDGDSTEEIDGLVTKDLVNQHESMVIVSNGTNWYVLGGDPDTIQRWRKGADVASAATLPLGDDGNYFDITGTTAITAIASKGIGTVVKIHFDAVLTLTHHATDLFLPNNGGNITTAAGDEAEFVEYATGDWRCVSYSSAAGSSLSGIMVQKVNTQDGEYSSGATILPLDDTIPQNTEGNEFMTRSITPISASNKLEIEVVCHVSSTTAHDHVVVALFQDTTANALAVGMACRNSAATAPGVASFKHYMTAGTTSPTTFKVRAGAPAAGTVDFNGISGGRFYGGVLASSITITEVLP